MARQTKCVTLAFFVKTNFFVHFVRSQSIFEIYRRDMARLKEQDKGFQTRPMR